MRPSLNAVFAAGLLLLLPAAGHSEEILQDLVARLTAPPVLSAGEGFAVRLLVPPGKLFDPLVMVSAGDAVWINDDGGEEKDKGSRLLAIDAQGGVSTLAGLGKLMPTVGIDIAPPGFGAYGGQVFSLAQPEVSMKGAAKNHIIQRIDPKADFSASVFCTLPDAGGKKIPGYGLAAHFGPDHGPFANRLFAVTIYNDAVYEVSADGKCVPFIVFDGKQYSAPTMVTFTPDGESMLVSVSAGAFDLTSTAAQEGAIVRVSADGKLAAQPFYRGPGRPVGMAFAPPGFGAYGGQLFFSDVNLYQIPVPATQPLSADGKVWRLTPEGKAVPVVSGMHNPNGLLFVHGKLWVADINGDFIAGGRELPDGYVVEIEAK